MKENVILELKDISKSFQGTDGKTEVLKDMNFSVEKGEFLTLLGASGSGKTTTLRVIAGLETPDCGQVLLNGKDITMLKPDQRDVNTVFQNYALFPFMNVERNVGYSLKIKKVPKQEIRKRVKEMLEIVQLQGYESRKPDELSGGQKQRVAIARALINEPDILLLDEPLGALDLKLRKQMQIELKRLQKKLGITFIYITHDQEEAINMSDRIAVMNHGNWEQIGTPNDIYYHPTTAFVADFVGNANIYRKDGKTIAVRSEKILIAEEKDCSIQAVVTEKNFAGGALRILFTLLDGQQITASRSGIDYHVTPGERIMIGWHPEDGVEVIDNL